MALKFNLTATEILRLLGYTEPIGKIMLETFERENDLKFPPCLFEFLCLANQSPLFSTADIWTECEPYFSYTDIEERIEEDKKYWQENPKDYAENEYFQYFQLPKEQWPTRVSNYLQIGSDYSAGVVTFGIRLEELQQENPPVYMLNEASSLEDWVQISDTLSEFLMSVMCDTLSCVMYDTAKNVLQKLGWNFQKCMDSEEVKKELLEKNIDLSAMKKYKSFYGNNVDAFCGYDEQTQTILVITTNADAYKAFTILKET